MIQDAPTLAPIIAPESGHHALALWYAEPLSPAQAERLAAWAKARRLGLRRPAPLAGLGELIARFWLGQPTYTLYERLAQTPQGAHRRALVELVHGQLLMSRRLAGAHHHLHRGFELAYPLLSARDYLHLLRRHEALAPLPLAQTPSPAEGLADLLRVAGVIRRLQPQHRGHYSRDPNDLYG